VADFGTIAARALSSAFATFGKDAAYHPREGWPIACRVIRDKADDQSSFGETPLVAAQAVIEVRASEIDYPERGGRFVVGAEHFVIVAQPRRDDPSGLVWTCLCRPEAAEGFTPWRPLP
jgi:hypothetical protein